MRILIFVLISVCAVPGGAETLGSDLAEMARSGRWDEVLRVARVRSGQLPLSPAEALLAASAARAVADAENEQAFLLRAAEDSVLAPVAAVELAELVVVEEPARAVDLVLDTLRKAATPQLREAAVDVAVAAVASTSLEAGDVVKLEAARRGLPRTQRRRLDLALALNGEPDRARLQRLLAERSGDLPALTAAKTLAELDDLKSVELWEVAQTFYKHALYSDAEPLLDRLDAVRHRSVPRWEVAFLRGRCAFRRGRWQEAVSWYEKAVGRTSNRERRADLEVHLARTLELDGDLEAAIEAARRAVRSKTTDDRRLFLARLRLRAGQPEFAKHGIDRLRSRSARARGELMLALDQLRTGDTEGAQRRLATVNRRPWRGPAAVVNASVAAEEGRWKESIELLNGAALHLDHFWGGRARLLMAAAPAPERDAWRTRLEDGLLELSGQALRHQVGRWAVLETDKDELARIAGRVEAAVWPAPSTQPPAPLQGIAGRLWQLGLEPSAVRWDPGGLPRGNAGATRWTATTLIDAGAPWRGISAADAAWRQAAPEVDVRAHPEALQRALFPLPDPEAVRAAGKAHQVSWELLAGVAREESRFKPTILSRVGARGLMQLMPATAAAVAERLEQPVPTPEQLFDPSISLDLGAAELSRLLEVFDGAAAPAVAAYNAGEVQAQQWLDLCGEGCTQELYLLNITFTATRNYTAQVLAAAAAYGELY